MSDIVKKINNFFREATKSEIHKINDEVYFSEHLYKVFKMFYLEKKDIDFIAHETNCSRGTIEANLRVIRKQLNKLI